MTRAEFLKIAGFGAFVTVSMYCLGGCANSVPTAPTNVDFTIDLTDPANSALNSNGGYIVKNSITIARTADGSFVAVSAICTHQGKTVEFDQSSNIFHCPAHNSYFSLNGTVLSGPASQPLAQYKTTLTGNSLRIYS